MNNTVLTAPRAHGGAMPKEAGPVIMTRVDRDLIKQIKIRAAQEDKSIQLWIDEALRNALKQSGKKK